MNEYQVDSQNDTQLDLDDDDHNHLPPINKKSRGRSIHLDTDQDQYKVEPCYDFYEPNEQKLDHSFEEQKLDKVKN